MNKKEFYSIGRGSLNLNGKFYYGLDYAITDFMRNMEQENTNLKQALNEIRNVVKGYMPTNQSVCKGMDEIEEIIDKNLGEEE